MAEFDLIIRGGTVVDGTGSAPVEADVAVSGGRIAQVGKVAGSGAEEIDAKGQIVTPGFVDLHTHYDGQVTWESRLVPSSAHGVTTAIIGNCGVGFAPVRPDQHDLLIALMEGVEDIPNPVLHAGLDWRWESFPDYLNVLAGRQYDIDFGCYVPHAPARVFVMGQRGVDREPATADDIAQMKAIVKEGVAAGAFGFGTSRTLFHKLSTGGYIPTLTAEQDELDGMAHALKELGRGVVQIVGDNTDPQKAFGLLRHLAETSGRPVTFSMGVPNSGRGAWLDTLDQLRAANEQGLTIKGQMMPRPIGLVVGHELTLNPFYTTPTYQKLAHLPLEERVRMLRRTDIKEKILVEPMDADPLMATGRMVRKFDCMFVLGNPANYEQPPDASIEAMAAKRQMTPEELAYDLMLEQDGKARLYIAFANFPDGSLDLVGRLLQHPDVVPGLGDGGAHCGSICDGSYSTFLLTHWTRDRATGRMALEEAVKRLSHNTAKLIGLNDRGLVKPGLKADLNVIDHGRLSLHAPEVTYDLPANGRRLVQKADGFTATVVNGVVTYRNGEHTGKLPGRLVRSA